MRKLFVGLLAVAVAALAGCSTPSSKLGGPGVTSSNKEPPVGKPAGTFELEPAKATKMRQGEGRTVPIGIKRGKDTDVDVTLKFENLPKGVTASPESPKIKAGDTKADVDIKAADDAAVGDFTIKITGHPDKGEDAHAEFKLTVEKK